MCDRLPPGVGLVTQCHHDIGMLCAVTHIFAYWTSPVSVTHIVFFMAECGIACFLCAMHALCMYSKFGHHPHPLGYLCAKFRFCRALHCWASTRSKLRNQSLNHSLTQLIWWAGNESFCFGIWQSECANKWWWAGKWTVGDFNKTEEQWMFWQPQNSNGIYWHWGPQWSGPISLAMQLSSNAFQPTLTTACLACPASTERKKHNLCYLKGRS